MTNDRIKTQGRVYLLAGGHGRVRKGPDPLLVRMLEHLGIPLPHIAYLGAANGDDTGFFAMMKRVVVEAGAGVVEMVPLAGGARVGARACDMLERADLVYVGGGDVEDGMRVLAESGADAVLTRLFRKGMPFLGLSAGSIMLAQAWVRWRDPEDDATAERFPCLGFAPFICDTHDEDSGWEELKAALSVSPKGSLGYGIPSGGGIIVEADGTALPLGDCLLVRTPDS
jgi:cyanophycinase-like exopeptidase